MANYIVDLSSTTPSSFDDVKNVTTSVLNSRPMEQQFCEAWRGTDDPMVKTANLCFAIAFLVPHTFDRSVIVMRAAICVGVVLFAVWSALTVCAPDILGWNTIFVVVNLAHVFYLTYHHLPPKIDPRLSDLYDKVFKVVKVDRKLFKELEKRSRIVKLVQGERYAIEGITPANQMLSILLTGRLKVSYDNIHLHYVTPNQFINSPEWESSSFDIDQIFQVTITAMEKCSYVSWSRKTLEQFYKLRPSFNAVIDSLIGKDITAKLYSVNEQVQMTAANSSVAVLNACETSTSSSAGWSWTYSLPRSVSVDAVNTGALGNLRSQVWQLNSQQKQHQHRRSSNLRYDSCVSTPAKLSRVSQQSDPAANKKNRSAPVKHQVAFSPIISKRIGDLR